MAASLEKNLFSVHTHYPLVIYHQDYAPMQRRAVAMRTRSPVAWFKIAFGIHSLPNYYDLRQITALLRPAHRGGNLSLPHMRGAFHGFGYRTMCRFFAGLIMWSPLVHEFDWYLRVDGGDSRIDAPFRFDPFVHMATMKYHYAYQHIETTGRSPRLDEALRQFRSEHTNVKINTALLEPFVDSTGRYNGRYYYNNFEIVRLSVFRSSLYATLFFAVDRSGAFMVGPRRGQSLGDADFRSMTLPYILRRAHVHRYAHIPYRHPVAWSDL